MRCCARDEGRPFGTALRREVPKPPCAALAEDRRGERHGKRRTGCVRWGSGRRCAVSIVRSLLTCRYWIGGIKTRANQECLGRSPADGRLLAGRCPACRRREPDLLLSQGTWEGMSWYCRPGWFGRARGSVPSGLNP